MQMTKKVVSVVLAVLMIMSMMVVGTVVASAAGENFEIVALGEGATGAVGDKFENINDAINAAGDNGEIKLITDMEFDGNSGFIFVSVHKSIKFDLNGHKIVGNQTYGINLSSALPGVYTFTVKDSSASQTGEIIASSKPGYSGLACVSGNTGREIVVESGTLTCDTKAIYSEGKGAVIKGGTLNGDIYGEAPVEIQGGTINGDVTVTGSGFYFDSGWTSHSDASTATVTNGTINGDIVQAAASNAITISGGTVNGAVVPAAGSDTVTVTGKDKIESNGKIFVVEEGTAVGAVAVVNGQAYTTLQAALTAAPSGATVTLIADINESTAKYSTTNRTYGIAGKSEFTLDGNGHTVTISNSSAVRGFGVWYEATGEGADITFKNITINNALSAGRAIDTRGTNIKSLTLDNVVLNCTAGGYSQALTIGGNPSPIMDLNIINNSEIHDSKYYAITTFNPVNATITNSTIEGWACIYAKGADGSTGSTGSVYNITNSTLISQNNYSSAGGYNNFAMVMLEDSNVEVNFSDCNITVKGGGDLQGIFMQNSLSKTNNEVNLGAGNNVTLTGDTAVFAENLGNNSTLEVTGGTFNTIIPIEYIADDNICVNAAEAGKFTIGADTNPLNSLEAVGPVTSDGNQFGIVNDYLAGSLIGVQRKDKPSVGAPDTSESGQEDTNDMRFVAVIDTALLKGAEDYGFVLAKVPDTKTTVNFDNLKAYWGNGEKTVSAKDTKNNVCGDEKYGDPDDSSTAYKYVTCAVNSVEDGYKIVARFFVKKDGKTYYGKYAKGGNYSDNVTGALVGMSDLVTA